MLSLEEFLSQCADAVEALLDANPDVCTEIEMLVIRGRHPNVLRPLGIKVPGVSVAIAFTPTPEAK
jgi:hypothetical protein